METYARSCSAIRTSSSRGKIMRTSGETGWLPRYTGDMDDGNDEEKGSDEFGASRGAGCVSSSMALSLTSGLSGRVMFTSMFIPMTSKFVSSESCEIAIL